MGDIVNLRTARKRKARADDERRAEENRARHGVTGAERRRRQAEAEKLVRHLDQHRREDGDEL